MVIKHMQVLVVNAVPLSLVMYGCKTISSVLVDECLCALEESCMVEVEELKWAENKEAMDVWIR